MARTLLASAVLALGALGCGRFGFSGSNTADAQPEDSAVDADVDAADVEPCNGIDDDGDGRLDEGCPCSMFDFTYDFAAQIGRPGFVWTGAGYLLLAETAALTSYVILPIVNGAAGTAVPFASRAATTLTVGESFAWSGAKLGIAYVTSGQAYVAIYDPATGFLPAAQVVSANVAMSARIVWSTDRFGVVWFDGTRASVREYDATGTPLTAGTLINVPATSLDAVAPIPGGYALGLDGSPPVIVLATRPLFVPQQVMPSIGGGAYITIASGTTSLAASYGSKAGGGQRLQIVRFDGQLIGSGTLIPPAPTGAISQLVVTSVVDGYRVIGNDNANPHAVVDVDFDATGAVRAGPTAFGSFTAGTWFGLGGAAADRRYVAVLPYQTGTGWAVKVSQRCD